MKKTCLALITALSVAMPVLVQAEEGRWDYRRMASRIRHLCKGSEGNTILRWGYPALTVRSLYRNWTVGDVFTEVVLSPESSEKLLELTQEGMLASDSCYQNSGFFLRYELVGYEALVALREAFDDSGISQNCAHSEAPAEALELYRRCTHLDADQRFLEKTGGTFHFAADLVSGVLRRMTNKWLTAKAPKNCEDIAALDEELYEGLAKAQRLLRKKLKSFGYIARVYSPGWN